MKKPRATEAVERISKLFGIERKDRGLLATQKYPTSPDQRIAIRVFQNGL